MVGAKAHAELAQCAAGVLIQRLDVVGDLGALEHAERFANLKRHAARDAFKAFAVFQIKQRPQQFLDVLIDPQIEAALHDFQRGCGQLVVSQHTLRTASGDITYTARSGRMCS